MSFISNILGCIGDENLSLTTSFRAVMIGDSALYIEGVKSILGFSDKEIILALPKQKVALKGEGMFIKKYCLGDTVICGKIKAFEIE